MYLKFAELPALDVTLGLPTFIGDDLDALRDAARQNLVLYTTFPAFQRLFRASVDVTIPNLTKAKSWVKNLNSNGGTEMYPALQFALRTPASEAYLRQVIFITDGAVGNEEGLFKLIDEKLNGARLFTVGIGSAPNSWFMRKAAESGRGTFTIISALHEVSEKMDRLFRKLEHPQVTNIDVQWPGGVVVDSYPHTVPDLYAGEPVTVKARASTAFRQGVSVRIAGDSVTGAWSQELPLDTDKPSQGIGALWARARIAELMDQQRRGANADETRNAIVATALAHHLVSKHTSLVAVDKTPVRPAGDPLSSEQVPNLMPYGQSSSAIFGFPATATNAPALRATGLVTLIAGLLMLAMLQWRRRNEHGISS